MFPGWNRQASRMCPEVLLGVSTSRVMIFPYIFISYLARHGKFASLVFDMPVLWSEMAGPWALTILSASRTVLGYWRYARRTYNLSWLVDRSATKTIWGQ